MLQIGLLLRLLYTYNQVADEDLQDLGLHAGAALEQLLQHADEDVAQRSGHQSTVDGHLRYTRGEVVAALTPVMGDPRREELLETRQRARGEHLGAQRVALQLLEVRLSHRPSVLCPATPPIARHSLRGTRWARRPWSAPRRHCGGCRRRLCRSRHPRWRLLSWSSPFRI
jgi:hypothetical protein